MKKLLLVNLSLLFLVGFFRVLKNCSKADDLARAGHVRNLDNLNYSRSYNAVSKYGKIGAIVDEQYATKLVSIENEVDQLWLHDLKTRKPELKNVIENAEDEINNTTKSQKIEALQEKYISTKEKSNYETLFKTAKTALDLKTFYKVEGNEISSENKTFPEDKTFSYERFKLKIPKNYVEMNSLSHPFVQKIWIQENTTLTVYKVQSDSIGSILDKWRAYKKGDQNHIISNFSENPNHPYQVIMKNQIRFGYLKFVEKKKKTLLLEVEFDYNQNRQNHGLQLLESLYNNETK